MDDNGSIIKLETDINSVAKQNCDCDHFNRKVLRKNNMTNNVDENIHKSYSVHLSKIRHIMKFFWKQKCKFFLLFKQAPLLRFWRKDANQQVSEYKDGDFANDQLSPSEKRVFFTVQDQPIGK